MQEHQPTEVTLNAQQLQELIPQSPGTVYDQRAKPTAAQVVMTKREDEHGVHTRYEVMAYAPEGIKRDDLPRIIEETHVNSVRRVLTLAEMAYGQRTYRYDEQGMLRSDVSSFSSGSAYYSNFDMIAGVSGEEKKLRKKMEIKVDGPTQGMPTFDSHGMITGMVVKADGWQKTYNITEGGMLPEEGVYAVTRFDNGDAVNHGNLGYGYDTRFDMRQWTDFDAVRASISELSIAELAHHVPEVNFAGRDLAQEAGEQRHNAKLACVTHVQETESGTLRTTTFEQQKGQYARHPWFEFNAIQDVVPKTITETIIDGVRREMVIAAGYKTVCTRTYDAAGRLDGGDDPAVVVAHGKGKLVEFYSDGKPHCLHGAWRCGKDLEGHEVEEYALHGNILSKEAFYALPQVQEACSLKGRLSRWFARATGQGGQADLAAIHGAEISAADRLLKVTTLLASLSTDMRREVVSHLATSFPDHAPAGFDSWHTANLMAVYQRDEAARNLLEKVSLIDKTALDIQKFAAQFKDQPAVKGVMETFAAEAVLLKEQHDASITRAAALPQQQQAADLEKQEVIGKISGLLKQGISPIPPTDEMRGLMAVITRDYTALPVPGGDQRLEFTQAAAGIDACLERISADMRARTQEISDSLQVVARMLDVSRSSASLSPIEDSPALATRAAQPPKPLTR